MCISAAAGVDRAACRPIDWIAPAASRLPLPLPAAVAACWFDRLGVLRRFPEEVVLRIDLVTTELAVGGAERCLTELALGLQRGGDRVRVAAFGSLPGGDRGRLVSRLRQAGIEVGSAGCDSSRQFFRGYRWMKRWFRDGQPEVVQTMLFHANVLGTLAARAAAVPICVGGVRVAQPNRLRLAVERLATGRMDAIVSVSQSVREFTDTVFPPPSPPAVVIGNGIDLSVLDQTAAARWSDWGWPDDAAVLLFVGRLHPQKGLADLQTALAPLWQPAALPADRPLRCLIVGDGPLRGEWQQLADQLASRGPVRAPGSDGPPLQVAGWRPDALSLMKACRALVLPSHYEGMPNVVLEAMAAGTAVAATAVEGVHELLGAGAQDQTCPPRSPEALRRLIVRLWTDDDLAQRSAAANRRRAAESFRLETMVQRYRQLYTRLLEKSAG